MFLGGRGDGRFVRREGFQSAGRQVDFEWFLARYVETARGEEEAGRRAVHGERARYPELGDGGVETQEEDAAAARDGGARTLHTVRRYHLKQTHGLFSSSG